MRPTAANVVHLGRAGDCSRAETDYHLVQMRISQAGLRSGFPTTRFAAPLSTSRESHLGLRRRLGPQMAAHERDHARVPLVEAVRLSARGTHGSAVARPEKDTPRICRPASLRRSDAMTWSRPTNNQAHRPRSRSAAPWRG
jgi:hypothetical protein